MSALHQRFISELDQGHAERFGGSGLRQDLGDERANRRGFERRVPDEALQSASIRRRELQAPTTVDDALELERATRLVLDGLANEAGQGEGADELHDILKSLRPRWFVVRDAHAKGGSVFLQPRWAMSFMRGPMTRQEIKRARSLSQP